MDPQLGLAVSKKRIVVVGGGGAGANIVRGLAKVLDPSKHELALITDRPSYLYYPAALRVLVSRQAPFEMVFLPYSNVFGDFGGELIINSVSSIENIKGHPGGRIILKSGEGVSYDVLTVATGSAWEGFLSFPEDEILCKAHIEMWRDKFEKADNIVVVGGGPVGIELAGEIKDAYPKKQVTIVQANKHLLNDIYPTKFRLDLERGLRLRGVNIIFDDVIEGNPDVHPEIPIKTRNGTTLRCDLLITARGAGPNTSLLKFLQPFPLTDRGYVQVLPSLQIRGHPSIFAAGDITDLPEAKQIVKTLGHASVIIDNIVSYLKGGEPKKECKVGKEIIVITNGRNGGAAYMGILWGIHLGNTVVRLIKSRTLLVWFTRKNLGLPSASCQ